MGGRTDAGTIPSDAAVDAATGDGAPKVDGGPAPEAGTDGSVDGSQPEAGTDGSSPEAGTVDGAGGSSPEAGAADAAVD